MRLTARVFVTFPIVASKTTFRLIVLHGPSLPLIPGFGEGSLPPAELEVTNGSQQFFHFRVLCPTF
jgi:hypothetical protein